MKKKCVFRNLAAAAYTLAVTYAVGKCAIFMAYLERGYKAVGGEYCLIPLVCWAAWKAINYLLDKLEDLENEQNCKTGEDKKVSQMRYDR